MVRWIGPVNHPQKNELLRHAAALLFPIQWDEPFGLVMIEAMACGTPVVAHRRGSVAEVVDDGVTGFHSSVIDGMAELVPAALKLDRAAVRAHAEARFGFREDGGRVRADLPGAGGWEVKYSVQCAVFSG